MNNNRTIDYLISFSKKDWKSFKKFQSERIKEGTEFHSLIKHILNYQFNIRHNHISIEYIHENLFPGKSRKNVLNHFSQLTGLIRDFLIQDQLYIDEHIKKVLLLQALNKRKLYQEANKLANNLEKEIANSPLDYFSSLYKQLASHHQYFSDNPIKYKDEGIKILLSSIEAASTFHEQIRALYFLEIENSRLIRPKDLVGIKDDFVFDKKHPDKLVNITYHLYRTRIHNDGESAAFLKKILTEEHKTLSDELRTIIYIILRMFFVQIANQGDLKMAYETFKLHKLIIENGYFEYEEQVDAKRFIPVVELSVFLSEVKWAEKFVEEYKDKLDNITKSTTIAIAKALINFGKNNFEETLDILNHLYPKERYLKNIVLRLSLITYLESYKEDNYFILQKIDNFKLFYYRNKRFLSKRVYESSNNLVKVIQMILQKKEKELILNEMKKMKYIFYRLYLYSKLEK